MQEMEPALDELEGMAQDLEPMLRQLSGEMGQGFRDLLNKVEDWSAYHPPEILPNGDIILRKRLPEDAPDTDSDAGGAQNDIEL
jgi:hypothetical protein